MAAGDQDATPACEVDKHSYLAMMHRQILSDLREAICEGHRQLFRELVEKVQTAQRQQLDAYLQSADRLLKQHMQDGDNSVRSRPRGSGDVQLINLAAAHQIATHQPSRVPLKLPSRALYARSWTDDCLRSALPASSGGPPKKNSSRELSSDESVGREIISAVGGSPAASSPRVVDIAPVAVEGQSKSDDGSEENERCKDQWHNHMKTSLTQRLGTMKQSKGSLPSVLPRKVSGALGLSEVSRRQTVIIPRSFDKSRLEEFVDGRLFHLLCGMTIVANSICIGIQTDSSVKKAAEGLHDPPWFHIVNLTFNIMFATELVLRMAAKKWRFLIGKEWKWNVFDFGIVLFSICEEALEGFSLTYTRLLRVFRMIHVLKVIRVMRFFRELRLMVCSIIQSLVSLSWALLLLLLVMYLFTICFMHAVSIYLHEEGHKGVEIVYEEKMKEHYGSVSCTMFSLLLAVSGGEDWVEIATPLGEVNVMYKILFAFYVLFVLIGVLNVLTSAFVQRACELSKLDRDLVIQSEMISDEAFLSEMKSIFEEVDADGTGKITWQKFRQYLQNEDVQAYFSTQQLDTSDARELFNLLDLDRNEEVTLEEFVMGCKRLRGQARSSDLATLMRESKRTGHKNMRALRKVDQQLRMLNRRLGLVQGVGDCSHASWMQSPTNASSYPATPMSRAAP